MMGGCEVGVLILIAIPLIMLVVGLVLPVIAKIFIHVDYVLLFFIIWGFVFGASGHNEYGLLVNFELHIVFVVLIYLAAFGIWFGLQQIRILGFYIFRVVACAVAAYFFVFMASTGWFGQTIADGMDLIWQVTVGIVYFVVIAVLRSKDDSLKYE